jgi:hypothetical protein
MIINEAIQRLPFTFSEKKEVLHYIDEICKRDGISETSLIEKLNLSALLEPVESPQEQKCNCSQIRTIIYRDRFPRLAEKEAEFETWRKSLKLPPEISLTHSPNFEEGWVDVKFRARNQAQFRLVLDSLEKVAPLWSFAEK